MKKLFNKYNIPLNIQLHIYSYVDDFKKEYNKTIRYINNTLIMYDFFKQYSNVEYINWYKMII